MREGWGGKCRDVQPAAFACAPGGGDVCLLPEKWDAADAVADGWTSGHMDLLMQSPDFLQPVPVQTSAQVTDTPYNAADNEAGGEQSRFSCTDRAVMYYDRNEGKMVVGEFTT
ncbi:MAG: hypothetical protein WDM70_02035 [Nitrosomonadales bacterium]